jgi:hypothetical protein
MGVGTPEPDITRLAPAYEPLVALYICPETQGAGVQVGAFVCGLKETVPLGAAFACAEDSGIACGAVAALEEVVALEEVLVVVRVLLGEDVECGTTIPAALLDGDGERAISPDSADMSPAATCFICCGVKVTEPRLFESVTVPFAFTVAFPKLPFGRRTSCVIGFCDAALGLFEPTMLLGVASQINRRVYRTLPEHESEAGLFEPSHECVEQTTSVSSGTSVILGPGGSPIVTSGGSSSGGIPTGAVGGRASGKLNVLWTPTFSSFFEAHGSVISSTDAYGVTAGLRWTF